MNDSLISVFNTRYANLQAKDAVYFTIRDNIVENKIPIGTTFTISSLAKTLYLSRTPVEYALNRLAQEKIIKSVKSNGFITYSLNFKEAKDSNEYLLNLYLSSNLIARNNIDFYYNNLLNEQIIKLQKSVSLQNFLYQSHKLHTYIVESTSNQFLIADFEAESIRSTLIKLNYTEDDSSKKFMEEHIELDKILIETIKNSSPVEVFEKTQIHNNHIRDFIFKRILVS